MSKLRQTNRNTKRESGITLVESLVALAILAAVAVVFLGGVVGTTKAAAITDEKTTALSIAQSQMEWVHNATYSPNATAYASEPLPAGRDYDNFAVDISVIPLNLPDDGIQKVTINVTRSGKQVYRLEGYKAER